MKRRGCGPDGVGGAALASGATNDTTNPKATPACFIRSSYVRWPRRAKAHVPAVRIAQRDERHRADFVARHDGNAALLELGDHRREVIHREAHDRGASFGGVARKPERGLV